VKQGRYEETEELSVRNRARLEAEGGQQCERVYLQIRQQQISIVNGLRAGVKDRLASQTHTHTLQRHERERHRRFDRQVARLLA